MKILKNKQFNAESYSAFSIKSKNKRHLTVGINDFDVHRVLVDSGSAANLLHLPAFKKMRVPLDHLNSIGRVLSGFNGATTLIVRDIAFLVQAGPVIQQVLFSVVEDLGPYNAILGQAWLHAMKAIPSTYHQTSAT